MKKFFLALSFSAIMSALAGLAPVMAESNYPNRPVTIVVPYSAGGGVDSIIRLLAPSLEKRLGQPVVVDNKPGVSGMVGAQIVARAKPDGYTILAGNTTVNSINPLVIKRPGYQPDKDFEPIAIVSTFPSILVVPVDSQFRTLGELASALRASPGKYSYGSSGPGSSHFLATRLFESMTDTSLLHVPYKGSSQIMTDLMGGQIDLAFEVTQVAMPLIRSGRIRALGVTSSENIGPLRTCSKSPSDL